ncbi:hypothetical protein EIKCOROL_02274 [Eikenella corrodens ATCC 23834]|uniref:Uncharacterized protein n=1 Tax=Eikenella corrodens ATCC 23834 TaxID=546274 RepID=C0DY12_EIKCO|nr:hypothetical protein EIKCOROL_02274 [Eikenella corrodens ATCC 23834]
MYAKSIKGYLKNGCFNEGEYFSGSLFPIFISQPSPFPCSTNSPMFDLTQHPLSQQPV